MNYRARKHEGEYLPSQVPPTKGLAGPNDPYSAMLSRKDLDAIGSTALYSFLHKTAHTTKPVDILMEQSDLLLHNQGLSQQGHNRPDFAVNKVADNRTRIVRIVAYSTQVGCWGAFTSLFFKRRPQTRAYAEQTVE